jgi:signal transduction histidine kinase
MYALPLKIRREAGPSAGDPALTEVRLSTRLSKIHLAVSLMLATAVVVGLVWISMRHDDLAQDNAREMVTSKIESFERRQRYMTGDNSIWTEAYDAVSRGDTEWLYENQGTSVMVGTVDLVAFVPPTAAEGPDHVGWVAETPPEGASDVLPPNILGALLDRLDETESRSTAVVGAYAYFDDEIWLMTAARVTHTDGVPEDIEDADLPRQIRGVRAGHLAKEIAEQFSLARVQIVAFSDRVDPEMDSVTLDLVNQDDQAALVWAPPKPGTRILQQIALPLGGILIAFFFVAFLLSRYAVKAARRLETAVVEAKAADRAKSQFLGIVSHELRTPMNGIIGLGQLLQAEEMGTRNRTLLATMMNCAQSQMRLIEQLLDIAQIESGKRSVYTTPFHPAQLLREIAEISRLECSKKNLGFELEDTTDASAYVIGDPQALRQIITNLVDNAIKFTETGSVAIRANAASCGDESLEYRISVADTGIGIDPADHGRIFQHLTQVDSSATRVVGGLGLGLSICRWLSDMMCGHILVDSALGKGSTFTLVVTFPVAAAKPRRIAA